MAIMTQNGLNDKDFQLASEIGDALGTYYKKNPVPEDDYDLISYDAAVEAIETKNRNIAHFLDNIGYFVETGDDSVLYY